MKAIPGNGIAAGRQTASGLPISRRNRFHRINDDTINEQFPQWIGDAIYYVSEHDGSANLWRYDVKSKRAVRVTSHDGYDVNPPGTDGKRLIYEQGGDLWLYDTHRPAKSKR